MKHFTRYANSATAATLLRATRNMVAIETCWLSGDAFVCTDDAMIDLCR